MHVIIAGAGLGGLALALSLARQNIKSTIYEIRSHPSDAGGSITLTAGAVRVLDNPVGVYDQLRAVAYSYTRMGAHSGVPLWGCFDR
jgi:2-polyprenyl-6-methoxyphenol hydroxylase-like FAD-dependent oxidoreductase